LHRSSNWSAHGFNVKIEQCLIKIEPAGGFWADPDPKVGAA